MEAFLHFDARKQRGVLVFGGKRTQLPKRHPDVLGEADKKMNAQGYDTGQWVRTSGDDLKPVYSAEAWPQK